MKPRLTLLLFVVVLLVAGNGFQLSAQDTKGAVMAADPAVGTWKLNVAKSKIPPGPQAPAKEETIVTREIGDQFEVTFTGTRTDGSPISAKSTYPQQGGIVKSSAAPQERQTVITVISPGDWYLTALQNGKQAAVGHYVISKDGKTMTDTGKGVDDKGKPVEYLTVWEKQ
jgi:hypothetical protein